MDLRRIASRVASPRRRSVLTVRGNVDSGSPGPARTRTLEELVDHLEADAGNAVLVWTGDAWVAVTRDRSSPSKYVVGKVPTRDRANELGRGIPSAREAVEAAVQLSGASGPASEP